MKHSKCCSAFLLALTAIMVTTRLMGTLFRKIQPAAGDRRSRRRHHARARRCSACVAPQVQAMLLPADVGADSRHHRADRRHPLHVPGRRSSSISARCAARATRRSRSRMPASSCRSCSAPDWRSVIYRDATRPRTSRFTSFALFMGVSMAITAFPVLARILGDRRLQRTPMGILALDLRRGRRRHRLVPAGVRRQRHAGHAGRCDHAPPFSPPLYIGADADGRPRRDGAASSPRLDATGA